MAEINKRSSQTLTSMQMYRFLQKCKIRHTNNLFIKKSHKKVREIDLNPPSL